MVFMIVTASSAIDDGSLFFSILMVFTGGGPLPSFNGAFSCTLYRPQQSNHLFQAMNSSSHLLFFRMSLSMLLLLVEVALFPGLYQA